MRYRVSGSHEVLGHKPGEEFEDKGLDPVTETRLYLGGHIERLDEFEYDPGKGQHEDDEDDDVSRDEA